MKLNAATRLRAASEDEVLAAIAWISSYVQSSMSMQAKYLKCATVKKLLAPLYAIVPQPGLCSGLIRVTEVPKARKGKSVSLKSNGSVVSWTDKSSEEDLYQIADDVGALGEDDLWAVRATEALPVLVSPAWSVALQKKVRRMGLRGPSVDFFLQWKPSWQAEYIVDAAASTKAVALFPIIAEWNK